MGRAQNFGLVAWCNLCIIGAMLPRSGAACSGDPFVQHASPSLLCSHSPPFGMDEICKVPGMLEFLRSRPDPATCAFSSCAVVGTSGNLIGAGYGPHIDAHEAVIRLNSAPDGNAIRRRATGTRRARAEWVQDLGLRTTYRVMNIEVFSTMKYYPRRWLAPPLGFGSALNMSGSPRRPPIVFYCIAPKTSGRCHEKTLRLVLGAHGPDVYMLNPSLLYRYQEALFTSRQRALSTGMAAVAMALAMCNKTSLYGFRSSLKRRNCSSSDHCVHYYEACHAENASVREFFTESVVAHAYDARRSRPIMHDFLTQVQAIRKLARELGPDRLVQHMGSPQPSSCVDSRA